MLLAQLSVFEKKAAWLIPTHARTHAQSSGTHLRVVYFMWSHIFWSCSSGSWSVQTELSKALRWKEFFPINTRRLLKPSYYVAVVRKSLRKSRTEQREAQ